MQRQQHVDTLLLTAPAHDPALTRAFCGRVAQWTCVNAHIVKRRPASGLAIERQSQLVVTPQSRLTAVHADLAETPCGIDPAPEIAQPLPETARMDMAHRGRGARRSEQFAGSVPTVLVVQEHCDARGRYPLGHGGKR